MHTRWLFLARQASSPHQKQMHTRWLFWLCRRAALAPKSRSSEKGKEEETKKKTQGEGKIRSSEGEGERKRMKRAGGTSTMFVNSKLFLDLAMRTVKGKG
eukprot:1138034-Pelagomonas_calceolata.AAC.2